MEELKSVVRREIDAHLEAKAEELRVFRIIKEQVIDMLIYEQDKITEIRHLSSVALPLSGQEQKSVEVHYQSGTRLYIRLHTINTKPPGACL